MDSPSLRSVAADANVLLSAATGKAAQRVFHESSLVVVTTEEVLDEVREYLAELAVANGMTEEEAEGHLAALPIEAYPESAYRRSLPAARRYQGLRDPDDIGLAALCQLARENPPMFASEIPPSPDREGKGWKRRLARSA